MSDWPEPEARSLSEAVYRSLRIDILACRLAPGAKVNIKEKAIAARTSVGVVRESLSRLAAEGLLIAEAQRGFTVPPVSRSELLDLTGLRIELETMCLLRAIRNGGVEWEVGMISAFERLARTGERLPDDPSVLSETWASMHKAFHLALVAACDSPWRLRLRQNLYDQSERYRRLSVPAVRGGRDLVAEHRALMEAALARDEALTAKLVHDHLARTTERVLTLADEAPEAAALIALAG